MAARSAVGGARELGIMARESERGAMQTIFIMVKCELGKAYDVADVAVSVDQPGDDRLTAYIDL